MADYSGNRLGQQLGQYRLVGFLGMGGFAEVYLGEHARLGSQAAIKILHTRLLDDDAEQFLQEARTIARLSHPHIVRVLDCDVEQGIPFIVMEYAQRGTLRRLHPKGQKLSLENIVSYTAQVASALQYAHSLKLIHRDIKPENMLVGKEGTVLLSDFGIATTAHSSSSQRTQDIAGTMAYMSPEQIQGYPRAASDQYALAVVVYEWLCGSRPFSGTAAELAAMHVQAKPPSLLEKMPALLPEIEEVVMIGLAKDYKKRFSSVEAFARALYMASQAILTDQAKQTIPIQRVVISDSKETVPIPTVELQPEKEAFSTALLQEGATNQVGGAITPVLKEITPQTALQTPVTTRVLGVQMNRRAFLAATAGSVIVVGAGGYLFWLDGLRGSAAGANQAVAPLAGPSATSGVAARATVSPTQQPTATPKAHPTPKPKAQQPTQAPAQPAQPTQPPAQPTQAPVQPTSQPTPPPPGTQLYKYNGHTDVINWVAWSPNSRRIASSSADQTVQIWNPLNGGNVLRYARHTATVFVGCWSPDGTMIASGSVDRTVRVWYASSGSDIYMYQGHTDTVGHLTWSPDGTRIASSSGDQTVQVWNALNGGNVLVYKGHAGVGVLGVSWSADGKFIASAGDDGIVRVWNASNGVDYFVYQGHSKGVFAVPWHPSLERIASGSEDDTVQVWNAADGSNKFTYTGHSNWVFAVSWSPDGTRIASAGVDKTAQLWNAADGKNRIVYTGHYGPSVNAIAWSPNGSYIVSGGGGNGDSSVQVWVAG